MILSSNLNAEFNKIWLEKDSINKLLAITYKSALFWQSRF